MGYAQKTLKELVAEEKAAKEAEKKAKAEEKARQEAEKKARGGRCGCLGCAQVACVEDDLLVQRGPRPAVLLRRKPNAMRLSRPAKLCRKT